VVAHAPWAMLLASKLWTATATASAVSVVAIHSWKHTCREACSATPALTSQALVNGAKAEGEVGAGQAEGQADCPRGTTRQLLQLHSAQKPAFSPLGAQVLSTNWGLTHSISNGPRLLVQLCTLAVKSTDLMRRSMHGSCSGYRCGGKRIRPRAT